MSAPRCVVCDGTAALACPRCKTPFCSADHQRLVWKNVHKLVCRTAAAEACYLPPMSEEDLAFAEQQGWTQATLPQFPGARETLTRPSEPAAEPRRSLLIALYRIPMLKTRPPGAPPTRPNEPFARLIAFHAALHSRDWSPTHPARGARPDLLRTDADPFKDLNRLYSMFLHLFALLDQVSVETGPPDPPEPLTHNLIESSWNRLKVEADEAPLTPAARKVVQQYLADHVWDPVETACGAMLDFGLYAVAVEKVDSDYAWKRYGVRLGDEVWMAILEHLSYFGLRSVAGVSKKLQRLVQDEQFNDRLFRTKPTKKKLTPANKLTIHPLLDATESIFLTTTSASIYGFSSDTGDDKDLNAYDLAACDEFATQPPCTQADLHVGVGTVPVSDRNGIKCRRIFKALAKFWENKQKWSMETNRERLGDHCGWTGWKSATVRNEGTVDFEAHWFDS
ncbi:hypothetical protein JCM8097_008559 [Rhodosporidiobolus ruineniae]